MAVGGGVILAASYEARAFGVHAAMPVGRARRLCPRLIVVDGSFGDYLGATLVTAALMIWQSLDAVRIGADDVDVGSDESLIEPVDLLDDGG